MSMRQLFNESLDYNATLSFIKKAHGTQKYGTQPYWTHPVAVCETGKKIFGSLFSKEAQQAALLHDVVEDTKYTIEDLTSMGYSEPVITAVSLLTKDKTLSYEDNIKKIVNSGSKIAMMVKYCDNYENFHGDKSSWPVDKREKSQAKYAKSMEILGKKLGI
jgi:(p)ppGpp synthase/HD superfamily hydrolase